MFSWRAIHRRISWLDIPAVILIAIVGFLSFKYEDFKEDFPRLITWQLRSYQWITDLSPRKPHAEHVVPIEIDDTTFYDFLGNETRNAVTDRRFLAELVEAVVASRAAVIALDINLDEERFDRAHNGPANALNADDQALLQAIQLAQNAKIPVVLTFGFRHDMKPAPQIFDNQNVSAYGPISYQFPDEETSKPRPWWVARFGFDNPGDDFRKVPLVAAGFDEAGNSVDYYSFALQATDSYEHAENTSSQKLALADKFAKHEFVYTTFMPIDAFVNPDLKVDSTHDGAISAVEVVCDKPLGKEWNTAVCDARNSRRAQISRSLLRDKIVLIGGNRHGYKDEKDDADLLDSHESPVGDLRGMYLQANYIEGLLDNRVLYKVNRWCAAFIDVALAVAMLWIASMRRGVVKRILILVVLMVPAAVAYFAAINLGYCIDFLFPLVLLVLHPAIEGYLHPGHEPHSEEIDHENSAEKATVVHRHMHTAHHVDRRIADSEPVAAEHDSERHHEEVSHESEETDVDEELGQRG